MTPQTLPDSIVLDTMLADVNEGAIHARLRAPYTSRLYRAKLMAIYFGVVGIGALLCHYALGIDMWQGPVLMMLYLGLFGAAAVLFAVARRTAEMQRRIAAAPIRQLPIRYVLSPRGVERNGAVTPWPYILDRDSIDGVTLLKISDLEAFPLPHKRLPDGVTPDDLHRAIDTWRQTA